METSTSLCLSAPQTLLQNSTNHVNQSSPMENFREFISRLAETRPNNPLISPTKTLLHSRLNQFASEYETPDHPPYSAMIQRALEELNEKKGSSEESISQYLEKRYGNLPWAHPELLKHHLEKLCESNEIVVTRDQRYGLPGRLNLSSEVKKKPGRRKRRWRYDWERERNYRLKKKLSNKKKKRNREKDEKEQSFTQENGVCGEYKSEQAKKLISCVVEKEYSEEMLPSRTITQQEEKLSEHSQDELMSSAESPGFEDKHPPEPKKISPEHKDTFEGKRLGMCLRPRRAKTEVYKDENFVACTSELFGVLLKPKPDPANAPQRRLRFQLSNPKSKVQIRRGRPRGRPPKRRAA